MLVSIRRPVTKGNRVEFEFASPDPLPAGRRDFFVEYPQDVSALPIWVHYNTALAFVLTFIRGLKTPVDVVLEDPFPDLLARFWLRYQDLADVTVTPLARPEDLPDHTPAGGASQTFGVLYGGGKDSLFTLTLLADLVPPERIKLISFSINGDGNRLDDVEKRRDRLSLQVVSKRFGVDVIKIRTNALSAFGSGMHIELYTAAMLPILSGIDVLTYSYEYAHYFNRLADWKVMFSFRRSRPEIAAIHSSAYSQIVRRPFTLLNTNYFMTELSSLKFLGKRLSADLPNLILMCEATYSSDARWCGTCTKCATFVLYSLYLGIEQQVLPPDRFLTNSPWIRLVLKDHAADVAAGQWFSRLTARFHVDSLRLVLAGMGDLKALPLSRKARRNLRKLQKAYGHDGDPTEACFYGDALTLTWPADLVDPVRRAIAGALDEALSPRSKKIGNDRVFYDPDLFVDTRF